MMNFQQFAWWIAQIATVHSSTSHDRTYIIFANPQDVPQLRKLVEDAGLTEDDFTINDAPAMAPGKFYYLVDMKGTDFPLACDTEALADALHAAGRAGLRSRVVLEDDFTFATHPAGEPV